MRRTYKRTQVHNATAETPQGMISKQPKWRKINGSQRSGSDWGLPEIKSRGSFFTLSESSQATALADVCFVFEFID